MRALLIALAALALVATACEGETSEVPEETVSPTSGSTATEATEDPQERLRQAADNTVAAGSATYEVSFGDATSSGGSSGGVTGTASETETPAPTDTSTESGTMTPSSGGTESPAAGPNLQQTPTETATDLPTVGDETEATDSPTSTDSATATPDSGMSSDAAAQGDVSFADGVRRVTVDGQEVIIEGSTAYVQLDGAQAGVGAAEPTEDARWGRIELGGSDTTHDAAAMVVYEDPEALLELLRGPEDVTSGGTGDVGGAAAESFTFTVSADQARGDLLSAWADSGVEAFDVEVWIDDQDLVQRISLTPAAGSDETATTTPSPEGTTSDTETPTAPATDATDTDDAPTGPTDEPTTDSTSSQQPGPNVQTDAQPATETSTDDQTATDGPTDDFTATDSPTEASTSTPMPSSRRGADSETVTWELTDIGADVTIEVPADDAVTDLDPDRAMSAIPVPTISAHGGSSGAGTGGTDTPTEPGYGRSTDEPTPTAIPTTSETATEDG